MDSLLQFLPASESLGTVFKLSFVLQWNYLFLNYEMYDLAEEWMVLGFITSFMLVRNTLDSSQGQR